MAAWRDHSEGQGRVQAESELQDLGHKPLLAIQSRAFLAFMGWGQIVNSNQKDWAFGKLHLRGVQGERAGENAYHQGLGKSYQELTCDSAGCYPRSHTLRRIWCKFEAPCRLLSHTKWMQGSNAMESFS